MAKGGGGSAHQRAILEAALARSRDKGGASPNATVFLSEAVLQSPTAPQNKDIWESIFGLETLFSWTVVGCLVPGIFLAGGFAMLTVDWLPHNLLISQVAFTSGALFFVTKIIAHAKESEGSVPRRTIFALLMSALTLVSCGVFCWNIQKHKIPAESELSNFQIKVKKNIIFPPAVGQQFRIDTHYQNFSIRALRLRAKSAVMVIDGTVPYYSISPSAQYEMQNKAWRDYYGPSDDLGTQNPVPPFIGAPPLEELWFSDLGHIATQHEYDDFNEKNGKLLIFTFVKIEWKDGETGKLHGYDTCKFTSGDVEVLHDCNSHNGPYTPKNS
jgi:hypothetical protein